MARSAILVACAWLALFGVRAAGQESPIIGVVGDQGAKVLSGPDQVHYGTSELEPGTKVQIYRLDPGRWCAIRPPADSFSLVRASALELVDEERSIAEVMVNDERCWIGTMLGAVEEPMWQIKLKRGERVRVLGAIPSDDNPDELQWYQIAPPSGEFRWMRLTDLEDSSQRQVMRHFERFKPNATPVVAANNNGQPDLVHAVGTTKSSPNQTALASYEPQGDDRAARGSSPSPGQWRQATRRRPLGDLSLAQNTTPTTSSDSNGFTTPSRTNRFDGAAARAANSVTAIGGPTQWPQALQALDLRLSAEVVKEPYQWQLDSILADVLKYKSTAVQPNEIATSDHLINKIRQFQQLQQGPNAIMSPTSSVGQSIPVQGVVAVLGQDAIPNQRIAPGAIDQANASYAQSFDAYGWLNELVRDEGMGQTTYVLQDDTGKITHLISATPGLNLHRYLKTKVGVTGQKGFHQGMKLDHVAAERVVSLDTMRR